MKTVNYVLKIWFKFDDNLSVCCFVDFSVTALIPKYSGVNLI